MNALIRELLVVAAQYDARGSTAQAVAVRDSLFAALAELEELEAARFYLDSLEGDGAEDGLIEQAHKLFIV